MRTLDTSRAVNGAFSWRAAIAAEIAAARQAIADSDHDQAIHQARVRLKRVRTLARLAGARSISRKARALKYTLSGWRDLAALENAARETALSAKRKGAAALVDIAARLSQARLTLGSPMVDDLSKALLDLQREVEGHPELYTAAVAKGARRIAADARHAWRRTQGSADTETRHRWRRREKDRLYAATILGDDWPAKRRRRLNDALGDVLGQERDARLLLARLKSEPAPHSSAARAARKALKRAVRKLTRKADRLGARLHRGGV